VQRAAPYFLTVELREFISKSFGSLGIGKTPADVISIVLIPLPGAPDPNCKKTGDPKAARVRSSLGEQNHKTECRSRTGAREF
jgi:hypothetical protein